VVSVMLFTVIRVVICVSPKPVVYSKKSPALGIQVPPPPPRHPANSTAARMTAPTIENNLPVLMLLTPLKSTIVLWNISALMQTLRPLLKSEKEHLDMLGSKSRRSRSVFGVIEDIVKVSQRLLRVDSIQDLLDQIRDLIDPGSSLTLFYLDGVTASLVERLCKDSDNIIHGSGLQSC